ncbi:MAG: sulfatase-like hydrolase/transferase [Bacteroidales bacterium]|nr:sulfatase-like hydrolase/transferase [Candidatus Cryptobacteroides caccocaballi]
MKITRYSDKIVDFTKVICNPVNKNAYFFAVVLCFLLLPSLYPIGIPSKRTILFDVAFSYTAVFVINLTNAAVSRFLKCILLFGVASLSILNLFLIVHFGGPLNSYMLLLLSETNSSESAEFIAEYLMSIKTLKVLGLFSGCMCVALLVALCTKHVARIIPKLSSICGSILIIVSLLRSAFLLHYFDSAYLDNYKYSFLTSCPIFTLINSLWQYDSLQNEALQLVDTINNYEDSEVIITGVEENDLKIILVVGESFNKYHSSLYGYSMETNPLLKQQKLAVFTNVISCSNSTSQVLKNLLSLSSFDSGAAWFERPLFPQIFRNAGFKVTFWSNQFYTKTNGNAWDNEGSFINDDRVSASCFDLRNVKGSRYDLEFVNDFFSSYGFEEGKNELLMIQLMGSHIDRRERFPDDFCKFSINNYQNNHQWTDRQIQQIADNDNSILYNDYVLNEIIDKIKEESAVLIYLSDHGDETHEFRDCVGRAFDFDSAEWGDKVLHNQVDIPFVIYVTESYEKTHSQKVKCINDSVDNAFVTDDLPHVLLDLASIQSLYFDPTRSLINSEFVVRKRFVENPQDFNLYDYDEICSGKDVF